MTWREYKRGRLTARERQELFIHLQGICYAVKHKIVPKAAEPEHAILIEKLIADEKEYMITAMLEALLALDNMNVSR